MTGGKESLLRETINKYTKEDIIVAFSGGADSGLLLKLACDGAHENGTKVYAVTARTMLHPAADLEIAAKAAKEAGAVHEVIEIDELRETGIEDNPTDRCYRCKKGIFTKIKERAEELGIHYILEGTNEDDLHQYRPGIKALKELGIISPLAECRVTKKEVRALAGSLFLSVAERPASPCLATRLPYGEHITYSLLKKIETGEEYIRGLGFYNVRLRVHRDIARIEVDEKDIEKFVSRRKEIIDFIKKLGFQYITADLEGFRSGSMDVHPAIQTGKH